MTETTGRMSRRQREFVNERRNAERKAAGLSRGEVRVIVDEAILALLADGPKSHAELSRRVDAPRTQVATRVRKLLRRREVAWVHGGKRLALYREKDVV